MSYQEKRTIVSTLTGALLLAAYAVYVSGQSQAGLIPAGDLKYWARTILVFIGIGVAASIVIQIVFRILLSIATAVQEKIRDVNKDDKEIEKSIEAGMVEDEMDKLIEMKSARIGFFVGGIGFVAALLAVLLGNSAVVMLNIIFISFSVGSLLEGLAQLSYYRRGVSHG